jgi:hypothetical protein
MQTIADYTKNFQPDSTPKFSSSAAAAPTRAPATPTADEIFASMPSAEEVFDKPYPPAPPLPKAWADDSLAVLFADEECARLIANCLFDKPITEEEIDRHARRYGLSRREAELEIREARRAQL